MKSFYNSLMMGGMVVAASVLQAIEPTQHESLRMPKPDNVVNRCMAAAEAFPNTGWYDGKYWAIWGDKQPVSAEQPELIWYALWDTAPSANDDEWLGRAVDWTTDPSGDVLIIFLDTLGNWNCGYYVVYRRNAENMFEYAGRVFTGSHVGWFDMKGIELQEDGFVLTYRNREDLPTVRHKFRYDKLENFVIPEHDYNSITALRQQSNITEPQAQYHCVASRNFTHAQREYHCAPKGRNSKARTCAGDRELAQSKRAKARAALGNEKKIIRAPQTCGATEKRVIIAYGLYIIVAR